MMREKIHKTLFKKFKWSFLILFFLVFLTNYLTFLVSFNLRQNLSFDEKKRGWFYYLFGKYSVFQKNQSSKIYVDWNKLLLILFLLYFPLKIIIQSILNYWQEFCQRKATVFLKKKLLNFASEHKGLIVKNQEEKIYIINQVVPDFSRQFYAVPIEIFDIFVGFFFNLFWLYFLIKSNSLFDSTLFIFVFMFISLLWLILFKVFTKKSEQFQKKKEVDYQKIEGSRIEFFLRNLNDGNKLVYLKEVDSFLDKNSQKFSSLRFVLLFLDLPHLIISGLNLLFLFLYYKLYLDGQGGLGWNLYFVALAVQNIFLLVRRAFKLLPNISSLLKKYKRIKSFFV